MEAFLAIEIGIALGTLTFLWIIPEIVNNNFISILTTNRPIKQQPIGRSIRLLTSLFFRIISLMGISWFISFIPILPPTNTQSTIIYIYFVIFFFLFKEILSIQLNKESKKKIFKHLSN